jgi:hypothetical protein
MERLAGTQVGAWERALHGNTVPQALLHAFRPPGACYQVLADETLNGGAAIHLLKERQGRAKHCRSPANSIPLKPSGRCRHDVQGYVGTASVDQQVLALHAVITDASQVAPWPKVKVGVVGPERQPKLAVAAAVGVAGYPVDCRNIIVQADGIANETAGHPEEWKPLCLWQCTRYLVGLLAADPNPWARQDGITGKIEQRLCGRLRRSR